MSYTQATLTTRIQALTNDSAGAVYTAAVILPYLNLSLDLLLADLRFLGAYYATVRGSALSVAASTTPTVLTLASSPALPAGLVEPLRLWERPAGGTEQDYIPMEGPQVLPNFSPAQTLRFWDLGGNLTQGFEIRLLGASATREVRIDGLYDVTQFTATQSELVQIPGSANALSFRTAALIAAARGDSAGAQEYNSMANSETEKLISTELKVQQSHPVRRQPYNGIARYLMLPS